MWSHTICSPVRVAHRTVFDAFAGVQFPHKLGLGVRVNALPGRPHIGSMVVTGVTVVALRLQFTCKQTIQEHVNALRKRSTDVKRTDYVLEDGEHHFERLPWQFSLFRG